ncbi:DUF1080 domain-containing protein [Planctomycetota bacterium]
MRISLRVLAALLIINLGQNAIAKGPVITDPEKADKDFEIQGEYYGSINVDGEELAVGAQVIALGDGKFSSVGFYGGLPGKGWSRDMKKGHGTGEWEGNVVVVQDDTVKGTIRDGEMIVTHDGATLAKLKRIERKSPTLGQKPPENAIVLFDGKSASEWVDGKVENGLLVHGTKSKRTFQNHKLHVEFRLPYQPNDRGQQRGNSGIYLQSRYEVQMLDSFGLEGENDECGGIYGIKKPDVNMCFPPLQWQTYDIEFRAANFEGAKMTEKPTMTVYHNGVLVHEKVELPKSTTAAKMKPGPEPGPVYLQDHGNPVSYQNIWVVEL